MARSGRGKLAVPVALSRECVVLPGCVVAVAATTSSGQSPVAQPVYPVMVLSSLDHAVKRGVIVGDHGRGSVWRVHSPGGAYEEAFRPASPTSALEKRRAPSLKLNLFAV